MARGGKRPGSGRKKGSKDASTLEKEKQFEIFRQLTLQRVKPLFEAQMNLARGVTYMFRIEEGPKGAREHVLVTDPDEIGDILAQMDGDASGTYNDQYYYLTTKLPDNRALDSLLDRAFGKPTQAVEITGKDGKDLFRATPKVKNLADKLNAKN